MMNGNPLWRLCVCLVWGGTLATSAVAQDAKKLAELKQWHDDIVKSRVPVTVEQGQKAQAKLAAWNFVPGELGEADQARWMRLTIHAALAVGDANRALEWLPELQRACPDETDTLRAAWVTAYVAGDAQLASRTLATLREKQLAGEKSIESRLAWLERVGHAAPDVSVDTDRGRAYHLRDHAGHVLLIDFWSHEDAPREEDAKALRALYDAHARGDTVQFLGINADAGTDIDARQRPAKERGYVWPQHYEEDARRAPLTRGAFGVKSRPWQVLIDADGNIRAVGSAASAEFIYAVRAAAAEASGVHGGVLPRTVAGARAEPRARPVVQAEPETPQVNKNDLPSNPEARKLLDQARVFIKTGRKTDARKLLEEIIATYPGTWEAAEAQERLEAL